ncbi:MAG: hypothetical protein EXS36_12070 [Pedosphaera sp.]|nr:hypothetical protein [Pedosphaera sp.]
MNFPTAHRPSGLRRGTSARRQSEGIALVITLIMLAVVTLTAVAFLAVSRRERSSVSASSDQIDARYFAEAATARAKAEIASRLAISGSRAAACFIVSTNFAPHERLEGANSNPYLDLIYGVPSLINPRAGALQQQRMLTNLLYDPRVPVFVRTNGNSLTPSDARYFLDLNQSRVFEPTISYVELVLDANGKPISLPGNAGFQTVTNCLIGDPQWIGILEQPDRPHSSTNRFVGRYAYVAVPTGRTLDLNYIHNDAKRLGAGLDGFNRNQGLGSWELNLAAYFRELNTNIWLQYQFNTNLGQANSPKGANPAQNANLTAARLYEARTNGVTAASLNNAVLGGLKPVPSLTNSYQDLYANGPRLDLSLKPAAMANAQDTIGTRGNQDNWPGADQDRPFGDPFQLLSVPSLQNTLGANASTFLGGTRTTNYTFYRLLSSLGTDTPDGRFYFRTNPDGSVAKAAKLNLNWAHDESGDILAAPRMNALGQVETVPFRRWTTLEWFTNTADRLLRNELTFNGYGFSITNIPVRHDRIVIETNPRNSAQRVNRFVHHEYDAQLHRLLQVALNIYDATTRSNARPTVLRPRFYRLAEKFKNVDGSEITYTNVYIGGFQEVTDADVALRLPWLDLDDTTSTKGVAAIGGGDPGFKLSQANVRDNRTDCNLYGVPWVIGAKKGYPNFNEAVWQTGVRVTRRLQLERPRPSAAVQTNLLYSIDLERNISLEAWNSYTNSFKGDHQILYTNIVHLSFSNRVGIAETAVPIYSNFRSTIPAFQFVERFDQRSHPLVDARTGISISPASGITNEWAPRTSLSSMRVFVRTNAQLATFNYTFENGRWALRAAQPLDQIVLTNRHIGFNVASRNDLTPDLSLQVTNYLVYAVVDRSQPAFPKIIDFVNIKSTAIETNILAQFTDPQTRPLNTDSTVTHNHIWMTNRIGTGSLTAGMTNQMYVSVSTNEYQYSQIVRGAAGLPTVRAKSRNGLPLGPVITTVKREVLKRRYFLGLDPQGEFLNYGDAVDVSTPFIGALTFSRKFLLTDRRAANDPLVHYTIEDLRPGAVWLIVDPDGSPGRSPNGQGNQVASDASHHRIEAGHDMKARSVRAYAPWGWGQALPGGASGVATVAGMTVEKDPGRKDPGITASDDWDFPNGPLPSVGWLGRVHRGTPWQTVYLKSSVVAFGTDFRVAREPRRRMPGTMNRFAEEFRNHAGTPQSPNNRANQPPNAWPVWAGNYYTHPVADWHFLHLFTTAINDNAARGLMSPNQTEPAAWAAALGGVTTAGVTTTGAVGKAGVPEPRVIEPATPEFSRIVRSINNARGLTRSGVFDGIGGFLSASAVTIESPYLPKNYIAGPLVNAQSDEIVERIPQQILSLMREDHPHYTIYAYGQSLKPAQASLLNQPGPLYGICTNYQVTGEFATKTVLLYGGATTNLHADVQKYELLSQ